MTGLPESVRDRLAAQQQTAAGHPESDILAAFSEDALTQSERTSVLEHLARCPTCRDVVAISSDATGQAAPVAVPAGAESGAPWWNWNALRWAAPAFAVIVVGAAVMLHDFRESRRLEQMRVAAEQSRGPVTEERDEVSQNATPQSEDKVATTESQRSADLERPPRKVQRPLRQEPKPLTPTGRREQAAGSSVNEEGLKAQAALNDKQLSKLKESPGVVGAVGGARPAQEKADGAIDDGVAESFHKDADLRAGAAAAPAAPPPAPAEKKSEARNYSTVQVDSAAPAVTSESAEVQADSRAKAQATATAKMRQDQVQGFGNASNLAITPPPVALAWRVADGRLSRTFDRRTWMNVAFPGNPKITVFTAIGPHLWVGGEHGVLFHSNDNGASWKQVELPNGGKAAQGDIAAIEFVDINSGVITTANGNQWTTKNAGESWTQKK